MEMVRDMDDTVNRNFMTLKKKNEDLLKEKEKWQQQLDALQNSKTVFSDQIVVSSMKSEALRLELRIEEIEGRKRKLNEQKTGLNTKGQLMENLKNNNHHISMMEKAINELNNKVMTAQETLNKAGKDEVVGSRQAKYSELKKREQGMEEFMSRAEEQREEEIQKLRGLENEIVAALKGLATKAATLPTAEDFKQLSDLSPPAAPLNTSSSLITQYKEIVAYLNKVQIISKQMNQEMDSLRDKTNDMNRELEVLSDVEKMKQDMEKTRDDLTAEYEELKAKLTQAQSTVTEANKYYKKVQKSLLENETNAQLVYLERKLATVEQSNFAIMDYMSSLVNQEDLAVFQQSIMKNIQQINQIIINNVRPTDM